jgi:hypothetical protein
MEEYPAGFQILEILFWESNDGTSNVELNFLFSMQVQQTNSVKGRGIQQPHTTVKLDGVNPDLSRGSAYGDAEPVRGLVRGSPHSRPLVGAHL